MTRKQPATPHPTEGTQPGWAGTLETLEEGMKGTVEKMTSAVNDAMANVGESVHRAVDSVKGAFDLKGLVQRNPWVLLAGCAVSAFLLGRFLSRHPDH